MNCLLSHFALLIAALPGEDFNITEQTVFRFEDVQTRKSKSIKPLVIPIINDGVAEPTESFICTLQGGTVAPVRGVEPNQVTIEITDDDGEYVYLLYLN